MIIRLFNEIRLVAGLLSGRDMLRWCSALVRSAPAAVRERSLGPADRAMGGSFSIRQSHQRLTFLECDLGVVREIFGHHCYGNPVDFRDARLIVDLGANCGAFTLFALANAPDARVWAVEAQPELTKLLAANLECNSCRGRVTIENALVGGIYNAWAQDLVRKHPAVSVWDIGRMSPAGAEIDFLKCDIEGAEFLLLDPVPPWFRRVRRFALEYHGSWQKGAELGERLRGADFIVSQRSHRDLGYLFGVRAHE